jgi:tetratricopeptide (TPR) repeat protein
MAKKKTGSSPQALENVEQTLTRTEQYLEDNYKTLLTGLVIIASIVGIVWLGTIYLKKRSSEAHSQMFQAERYFELDSAALALNGDGNYLGFLDITKSYKMTKAANLAKYYSGICYLKLGEYENAIDMLTGFSKKDKVLGATATGAIGDAWVELGDMTKGAKFYTEAADFGANAFLTPIFLMKAGQVYEAEKNYVKALEMYNRILDDYPASTEGTTIEKHIARVNLLNK